MNELQAIVDAYEAARRQGKPVVLATVVAVEGSTYRRPGARMLLTEEGWVAGSISGGCLEGDVAKKAWWRTERGRPALVTYDSRSADDDIAWGFGLGCNGMVQVLLERLGPRIHPTANGATITSALLPRAYNGANQAYSPPCSGPGATAFPAWARGYS